MAVKFHKEPEAFARELKVYQIFAAQCVTHILGFSVPQLLGADPELLAIRMTVVSRPFLLDFAAAYLTRPNFSDETWAEWRESRAEVFGEQWASVVRILNTLESLGIYMSDVNRGNIGFLEDQG